MATGKKRGGKKNPPPPDTTPAPATPWGDAHEEVEDVGIGTGFARWSKIGQHIRGVFIRPFKGGKMNRPAAIIRLTERPGVDIEDHGDLIEAGAGDLVNVGINRDLERKLTTDLQGVEVGIMYECDIETRKGTMRGFKVVTFGDLPF